MLALKKTFDHRHDLLLGLSILVGKFYNLVMRACNVEFNISRSTIPHGATSSLTNDSGPILSRDLILIRLTCIVT